MKILRSAFLVLILCAAVYPQTVDQGQGIFYNGQGAIALVLDTSVANLKLNDPYVMFMVFMAAKGDQSIAVNRDDVTLVYQDKEYKMPSVKELREKYSGQNNDIGLYRRLGKESLALSPMRLYTFPWKYDFFPVVGLQESLVTDEGSMASTIGFRTKLYFKNPGFKKGDKILIRVMDRKNPALTGEVAAVFK